MKFAKRVAETQNAGLNDLYTAPDPQQISFAGGYPDPAMFPQAELQAAMDHAMANAAAFQYADSWGYRPLRDQLATMMQADGIETTGEHIMITQGAQQGIDLTARLMIDPGDGLVVEAPTYLGAMAAFNQYEPNYYEVPMEDDGMDLVALKKILMTHSVKMIYTVPDFQNPTGTVMSLEKRKALVRLANQFDVLILEDGPYRFLRYEGTSLPPVKSFDTQGRVVFLGSMSKILSPSLRLGWLIADPEIMAGIEALKGAADVESSALIQRGVTEYLKRVDFPAHLAELRETYRDKRDVMLDALQKFLPADYSVTEPNGGFFLWLQGPTGLDMTQLQREVLLPAHVSVVPGRNLAPSHTTQNGARLTYAAPAISDIEPGVRRLAAALSHAAARVQVK
ncbi:PLP-dependent aminotransferase family protein [Lacticaseibacillus sp. 866-1]|uniref:aminotransferase-like domain-containing protein n=1 Tax=Lacticaseibacillus sp. 866-1 TaxID=2799576 RepID=UPI001943E90E|nr:PLP-dependent aminotransferase family protein [Lacticaseibacillus sp. 866-1]